MSRNNNYDDPTDQDQLQGQLEGQAQGQLGLQGQGQLGLQGQGQLELQGQGQGQGQGQAQDQSQMAYQAVLAGNYNENGNENDNDNKVDNKIDNGLDNKVDNDTDNSVDNSLDNKVDNSVDNDLDNKVENTVTNDVSTRVDVDVNVDLDLKAEDLSPPDNDIIDIEHISDIAGSIVAPDAVTQNLWGDGNQFNIDQVNNLVDNDSSCASLGFGSLSWADDPKGGDGTSFSMWASAEGGDAKMDSVSASIGDDGNLSGIAASADAVVTQEAFTQNIVLGSNIQFNQIDLTVAGHDLAGEGAI